MMGMSIDAPFASRRVRRQISGQSAQEPATPKPQKARSWEPEDSAELYNIGGWGWPYFEVNSAGHLAVRPHGAGELAATDKLAHSARKLQTDFL